MCRHPAVTLTLRARPNTVPSTLADQIAAWLPGTTSPATTSPTVATLKQVTAPQWTAFFTVYGGPQWLPPFTEPVAPGASPGPAQPTAGYIALRIRAFIRAVHQFFTVSSAAPPPSCPAAGDAADLRAALVRPDRAGGGGPPRHLRVRRCDLRRRPGHRRADRVRHDAAAQAWLAQAMTAINELWQIASVAPDPTLTPGYSLPDPVSFAFSVMEALYARGFQTATDITNLSGPDFQQALTGTVAYDCAGALYTQGTGARAVLARTGPAGGTFQPVNPDGSLVNCVPPPCLSPTGPIAYLQEMLTLSELSTCEAVVAGPVSLTTTADAPAGTTVLTFLSTASVATGMSATAAASLPGPP